MSRQYLEAVESVDIMGVTPEFIRADITGKTEAEVAEIKALIVDVMAGINYCLVRHICYHGEDNRPCVVEEFSNIVR